MTACGCVNLPPLPNAPDNQTRAVRRTMVVLSILLAVIGGSSFLCYAVRGDWPPAREFPIVAIPLAMAALLIVCSRRLSARRKWLRRAVICLCCLAAVYPGLLAIPTGVYALWLLIQGTMFCAIELVLLGQVDRDAMGAMASWAKQLAGVFWFFAIYALALAAAVRLFFQLIFLKEKSQCPSAPGMDVASQQMHPNVG